MTYLTYLLLPAMAGLNYFRGRWGLRAVVVAVMAGAVTTCAMTLSGGTPSIYWLYVLAANLATLMLLFVFGWGEYFPVTWNPPAKKEVWLIDVITSLFIESRGMFYKVVAMSLRWFILGIPFYVVQGYVSHDYLVTAIAGCSLLLAGPAYMTMNLVKGKTDIADVIMGLILAGSVLWIWN